jgi:cell wall-associated NlpC family hydrolase
MDKYIGKEYEAFARGPDKFDCLGLVIDIYKEVHSIDIFDHAYNNTHAFKENSEFYSIEEKTGKWDEIISPAKYDLVVFDIGGYPVHVGVMIDSKRFIHAHESCNIAVESIESVKWRTRINGFYRHRDAV